MLPRRISNSAVQTHCPTNVKHFEFWSVTYWTPAFLVVRWPEVVAEQTAHVYMLLHILVRSNTHAEVSVPDLDGAILTACSYQLPVAAVGAACGHYLLPLEGAWLEHRFVLLLWLHVPRAHRAVNREKINGQPREIFHRLKSFTHYTSRTIEQEINHINIALTTRDVDIVTITEEAVYLGHLSLDFHIL